MSKYNIYFESLGTIVRGIDAESPAAALGKYLSWFGTDEHRPRRWNDTVAIATSGPHAGDKITVQDAGQVDKF